MAKITDAQLTDALTDVFRTYGYEGATLSRISEATGLQRASLYHRFPGGKEAMARFHSSYANLQYTIEDMIAEGDKVMVRATARGIHTGDFMTKFGKATATGKEITYAIIFIYRLADGKLVDLWEVYDNLARMQQLGVLPE